MAEMKNRVSGLLMETGVSYNKQRLHKVGYFGELMSTNADISDATRPLLVRAAYVNGFWEAVHLFRTDRQGR